MGLIDFIMLLNASSVQTGGGTPGDWVLESGFWEDAAYWDDDQVWIDSPLFL